MGDVSSTFQVDLPYFWEKLTHLPLDKMATISQTIFSDAFSWIKICVLIRISQKFVPKDQIGNNPPLVYIMAWCQIRDKPLTELTLTRFIDAYMQH